LWWVVCEPFLSWRWQAAARKFDSFSSHRFSSLVFLPWAFALRVHAFATHLYFFLHASAHANETKTRAHLFLFATTPSRNKQSSGMSAFHLYQPAACRPSQIVLPKSPLAAGTVADAVADTVIGKKRFVIVVDSDTGNPVVGPVAVQHAYLTGRLSAEQCRVLSVVECSGNGRTVEFDKTHLSPISVVSTTQQHADT
jgi:hypothetical protein